MAPANIALLAFGACLGSTAGQKCLANTAYRNESYINAVPAPGDANYGSVCKPWASKTCCTSKYTHDLATYGMDFLYPGFSFDHCSHIKPVSAKCMQFLMWEECFYACDPYAAYYEGKDPTTAQYTGTFANLPVCGDYCDQWFDACADDYTCVANWATWPLDANGSYTCPLGSTCQTYRQVYGSGQGLCNTQWGSAFFRSDNMATCFSFWHWGGVNPNQFAAGITPASGAAAASLHTAVAAVAAAVAAAVVGGLAGLDG